MNRRLTRNPVSATLFNVAAGGNLTLGSGITLDGEKKSATAAAISSSGNLALDGATIQNFVAKPTINILAGNFVMNSGTIQSNTNNEYAGFVNPGYPTETAPFANYGTVYVAKNANFTMNGGEITGNTAYAGGGGIVFVDWYGTGNMNVEIVAGSISNNTAEAGNGGGIYDYAYTFDLQLKNVSIDHNDAYGGGGIGNCPTASLVTYVTNGGIYNDNTATNNGGVGGDFYFKASPAAGNTGTTTIATRVLGGGEQAVYNDYNPRYVEGDTAISAAELKGISDRVYYHNETSADAVELAQSEVKLRISGNKAGHVQNPANPAQTAGYGGGIYFNGVLTIGEPDRDKTLTVEKDWSVNSKTTIPDEVTFDLIRVASDGSEVSLGTFTVSKADNWTTTIANLPGNFDYKIVEQGASDWEVNYVKTEDGANVKIVATNSNAPDQPLTPPIVPGVPNTGISRN